MNEKPRHETAPGGQPGAGTQTDTGRASCHPQYTAISPFRQETTQTTPPTWADAKATADAYWPAVQTLLLGLGFANATPAPIWCDWQGVDIVAGNGARLAWRNRSAQYLKYADITLRVAKPSGHRTEVDKLADGGGADLLLWTWHRGRVVCEWLLLDAAALRPLLGRKWPTKRVHDATFAAVPFRELKDAGAIRAASRGVWQMIA